MDSNFHKVKSYLEDESLFRDIEKSAEYQDPLSLNNIMEQSAHTDSAPIDVEDIQLEPKSSHQKSMQSKSNAANRKQKQNQAQGQV